MRCRSRILAASHARTAATNSRGLFHLPDPVDAFIVLWDGMVSMLRIYSPEQLKESNEDLQGPDYTWETGGLHLPGMPGEPPYLIGRPIL